MSDHGQRSLARGLLALGGTLRKRPAFATGLAIIVLIGIIAAAAPLLERYPPEAADPAASLQGPSGAHWFGTDPSGFDIYSRVVAAARVDLEIAFLGTAVAVVLGGLFGILMGYTNGPIANTVARLFDLIQSFPVFILALMLVALFGQGARNIIFAIAFVYTPLFVRLFRVETLRLRERGFVRSAQIFGASRTRILARHIMPNSLVPALGQWGTAIAWAILMAAGLSFVGAGIRPPEPEWGSMVATGAPYVISGEWWVSFFPGIAITITVLAFTVVSEGLQDVLDPRRR